MGRLLLRGINDRKGMNHFKPCLPLYLSSTVYSLSLSMLLNENEFTFDSSGLSISFKYVATFLFRAKLFFTIFLFLCSFVDVFLCKCLIEAEFLIRITVNKEDMVHRLWVLYNYITIIYIYIYKTRDKITNFKK